MFHYRLRMATLIAAVFLTSCSSAPPLPLQDPIDVMMDTTEGHSKRWRAARQAETDFFESPERIHALRRMVHEPGYPAEYSNYAVDQLVVIDEKGAKRFLAESIIHVNDWLTLRHIIDTAVGRRWTDFVPALVHNYAQATPVYKDPDRPERHAIAALAPHQPVDDTVLDVFTNTLPADVHQRTGAWQLLCRLTGSEQRVIDRLSGLTTTGTHDTLVTDLQNAARDLNVVPTNRETVTWVRVLQTEPYRPIYRRMTRAVASLTPDQKRGLKLRHLAPLVYLTERGDQPHTRSHQQLLQLAAAFNAQQTHHLKGPTYDGPMDEHPQRLRDHADQLAWGDLLTLNLLQEIMTDRGVTGAWFEQADADLANTSTEYGGLLRLNADAHPTPFAYHPAMIRHDLVYHPPAQLVIDAYTALAHYHFHAQKHKNKIYAGPGLGDLKRTAQTQRFNGLVLTFIDENQLNVDFYQNPQTVIDLGTVHR